MPMLLVDHDHPIWCTDNIVEIDDEIEEFVLKIENDLNVELVMIENPDSLVALWSDDDDVCAWCREWMLVKAHVKC